MADALRWLPVSLSLRVMRRALLVLLTALVLVQTVGVLHRVAHASSNAHALAAEASGAAELSHPWSRLWADHSSLADCQLFDQACPDLLLSAGLSAVAPSAVHVWQALALHARVALFERFYAARGPPADS
jgi:hypothetical protein